MTIDFGRILLLGFGPLLLKSALYFFLFKIRSVKATLLNCIVISGSSQIVQFVPLPVPSSIHYVLTLGLAIILTMKFTEADLYPDGLFIPVGVELTILLIQDHLFALFL